MTLLLVALGAAVGAPLRYLIDHAVRTRWDPAFPWGTWCANVTGSFLFGALAAAATAPGLPAGVMAAAGIGFCGALTTYSAFGYEAVRLIEHRSWLAALCYVAGSVLAGLGAAVLAAALVRTIAP